MTFEASNSLPSENAIISFDPFVIMRDDTFFSMKNFNASQIDLKENEVLRCRETLQEQVDRAEKEL